MDIHDATEQAYKNGYQQGVKDLGILLMQMCGDPHWCVWLSDISAALEKMGVKDETIQP